MKLRSSTLRPGQQISRAGAGKIEYILLVSFVAIVAIGAVLLFSYKMRGRFADSSQDIAGTHKSSSKDSVSDGKKAGQESTQSSARILSPLDPEDSRSPGGSYQLARLGNENANIRFGTFDYGFGSHSGFDPATGKYAAGYNAGISTSGVELNLKGMIGDEDGTYGKLAGQVKLLSMAASVDSNVAFGLDGVSAEVEGGAEINVAEGKATMEGGFIVPDWVPIPGLGGAQITAVGQASGQIGASVKGRAVGQLDSKGAKFGIGGKAAAGLGGGFNLNVAIKFN